MIGLSVRHSLLRQRFFEIRFDPAWTLLEVKEKIYQMTGTLPQFQDVWLERSAGDRVKLSPDSALLRDLGPEPGMALDVADRNPHSLLSNGGLNDVSLVAKNVMSDAEYDQREGTVRAYLRAQYDTDPAYRAGVDAARARRAAAIQCELRAAAQI